MSRPPMKPGRIPVSCITCRRRRKKCDLSRPCCQRCLKGGYECLGYADTESRMKLQREDPTKPAPSKRPSISLSDQARAKRSETQDPVRGGSAKDRHDSTGASTGTDYDAGASILGAALFYRINGPVFSNDEDNITVDSSEFDHSWPQEQRQLTVYWRSQIHQPSGPGLSSRTRFSENDLGRAVRTLYRSIPPSVDGTLIMRENYSVHVISGYQEHRTTSWFMPPPAPIRDVLVARLKGSKRMIWALGLGTKLLQAVSQDPNSKTVRGYISWIDNVEQRFAIESHGNSSMSDIAERLMAQIELAFLKFTVVDSISGYASLQKALPRFYQLTAADKTLQMEDPSGSLVVSLPHTLGSPRPEIKQFVLYDTAASLVFGVPPLVEYGYDGQCDSRSHGLEWVHGIPVLLVETISQVNSWRAGSRVASLDHWQELERRVMAWKPHLPVPGGEDPSTANVARLAVQESWRHAVLIYIYMGVCRVSSHDSRVQDSVRQILQLGETVANVPVGLHMMIPYVIAGLATRLEKHRVHIHEKLLSFKDTRVWFFRGPQFSQVLYHLWHGVGEGGAPVTWDDYVQSRCAIVPI